MTLRGKYVPVSVERERTQARRTLVWHPGPNAFTDAVCSHEGCAGGPLKRGNGQWWCADHYPAAVRS